MQSFKLQYILTYPNTDRRTLRMHNDKCSQLRNLSPMPLRYMYKEIDHERMADRLIESPSASYAASRWYLGGTMKQSCHSYNSANNS